MGTRASLTLVLLYILVTSAEITHAGDIAELLLRAENTTRQPAEAKHPPRCTRDDTGQITELNLDFVSLTKDDFETIASLGELRRLSLASTNIADEQLQPLTNLSNLRGLILNRTAITDEGLLHIAKMKALKSLCLGGVDATPEGVARLRQDLPKLSLGYFRRPMK